MVGLVVLPIPIPQLPAEYLNPKESTGEPNILLQQRSEEERARHAAEEAGRKFRINQFNQALGLGKTQDEAIVIILGAALPANKGVAVIEKVAAVIEERSAQVGLEAAINQTMAAVETDLARNAALARIELYKSLTTGEKILFNLKQYATAPGGARGSQADLDRLMLAETDSEILKVVAKGIGEKYLVGKTLVAGAIAYATNYYSEKDQQELAALAPEKRLARIFEQSVGRVEEEKKHPELTGIYKVFHQSLNAARQSEPDNLKAFYKVKGQFINAIQNGTMNEHSFDGHSSATDTLNNITTTKTLNLQLTAEQKTDILTTEIQKNVISHYQASLAKGQELT